MLVSAMEKKALAASSTVSSTPCSLTTLATCDKVGAAARQATSSREERL